MTNKSLKLCAATITVALGMSVTVTASLVADEAGSKESAGQAAAVSSVETNHEAKADLQAKLDDLDLEPLNVRCVSQSRTTTCTGWPVPEEFEVSGLR